MERTALVLSGGGLRGAAHVGILKVFERVGLLDSVHVVTGTSAGAIVGAMLASGARVAAIEKAILGLQTTSCDDLLDINGDGLRQALCTQDLGKFSGFLGGKAITELVEKNLVHIRRFTDYANLPPDLQAAVKDLLLVAVNLDTGDKVVFCDPVRYTAYDEGVLCGRLSLPEAARASGSAPPYVTPVACPLPDCGCGRTGFGPPSGPQYFVDGAVRENCPVKLAVHLAGCTRVLAVNLGYAGDRIDHVASQGVAEVVGQSLAILGSQHLDADLAYLGTQVAEGDVQLSAFVLNPHLYDMGILDFDRLDEAIRRGEVAAQWFIHEVDRQLHILKPDGSVDIERMFMPQGVFKYSYPDPEREERRQVMITARQRPRARRVARPCHAEKELLGLVLLTVGAIVSISLALFTVGGMVALRLKPNAASAADVFAFWDGGVILFLVGWAVLLLLMRLRLCRSK